MAHLKKDVFDFIQTWSLRDQALSSQARLTRKRVFLLPTKLCFLIAIAALCIWIGALNYTVSLAYALAFWLISLLIVSAILTWRQLLELRLSIGSITSVYAGETVLIPININFTGKLHRRFQIAFEHQNKEIVDTVNSIQKKTIICPISFSTQKRGRISVPVVHIFTDTPFGLFLAFSYAKFNTSFIVYPKALEDINHSSRNIEPANGELHLTKGEDNFSHLSEYQPGEPIHTIAWKVLAKQGHLVSKRFTGEQTGVIQILSFDDYPSGIDLETKLSYLTWRILQAEHQQQPYVLQLPNQRIEPQWQQKEIALTALALYNEIKS